MLISIYLLSKVYLHKIAVLLILMLKTTRSSNKLALTTFRTNNNKIFEVDNRANKIFKNLSKYKKLKNEKFKNLIRISVTKELIFRISSTRKAFNFLKQVFVKALII